MDTATPLPPNHHAHFPGFSGPTGLFFAVMMATGRNDDAVLAAELTGVGPGIRLLDIGSGPGAAVRHAASLGATAVGVDPSPPMLRVARARPGRRSRITYLRGSAEQLPVPDASADVAWSIACVHHWADLDAGLAEVVRVLRPGGKFLAMERRTQPGADGLASHGWTDDQADVFAATCTAAGLTDVRTSRHQAGQKPVVAVICARQ